MKWEGSTAVITGASRGIGRAVALAASKRGARVGLVARSKEDLERVLAEIEGRGAVAIADVAEPKEIIDAIAQLERELGPIDILVNNAGIGGYGRFEDTDIGEIEQLMRVNFFGTVNAMKAVIPSMRARKRGHIVNVSSVVGRMPAPMDAAYSASKFAVTGLSEAVAVELADRGIRVSIINPGPVDSHFFEARGHPYAQKSPRPIPPERVAQAVLKAVERNRTEVYVPGWLGQAFRIKALFPPLYRIGSSRAFRDQLG